MPGTSRIVVGRNAQGAPQPATESVIGGVAAGTDSLLRVSRTLPGFRQQRDHQPRTKGRPLRSPSNPGVAAVVPGTLGLLRGGRSVAERGPRPHRPPDDAPL